MNKNDDGTSGELRIFELRQYKLKPGRREELIALFERHFLDGEGGQEEHGITVLGQFRDLGRPDHFVWMRGFADMEARHRGLEGFYGGPVWAEHKGAANETMIDSDDVLLLQPAGVAAALDLAAMPRPRPSEPHVATGMVVVGIHLLPQPVDDELRELVAATLPAVLRAAGARPLGSFVSEPARNTFPRLPVREGEHAIVWLGTTAEARAGRGREVLASAAFQERLAPALAARGAISSEVLDLEPTRRSRLRHRPEPDAGGRDFDFLHGRWRVHNRRLVERLVGCTEWVEFEATNDCRPMLGGVANVDEFVTDFFPGFHGMTVRLFDPKAKQWSLHWADNHGGALEWPMRGAFAGDVGTFFGGDVHRDRAILSRFTWRRGPSPRWEQAFSADGGYTWETNWTMDFTREG